MGQLKFTISIVMIALFSIAILGFAIQFASDNDASMSLADEPISNLKTDTESSMSEFNIKTDESYKSIVDASITKGDTLESGGTFALTIPTAIATVTNILDVGWKEIFGSGGNFGIFFTIFVAIIGFIAFMYFAKTWLGRNPD